VIVRAVTDLAHHRGSSGTAEGVESEAVADELRRLGCDDAQGYHWARPMPLDELLASDLIGRALRSPIGCPVPSGSTGVSPLRRRSRRRGRR
jgi:predicted signal transduction protein with EAL and GGDEF domain